MRLAIMALGVMLVVAVGIYIGLSGFQQYAVEGSRSRAGQVLCAPDQQTIAPGRSVAFSVSGLPENTTLHWSSPLGRTEQTADGRFSVVFSARGEQTVYAFFLIGNLWQRTACTVSVR